MPQLGDPNFHRSVILMLEHSDKGAMGLVINRRGPITLKDVAEGQELQVGRSRASERVFMGGPVEPQRGFVLHDRPNLPETTEVIPGVFLSVTLEALSELLAAEDAKVRFCLGCAGWGPNQLESEINEGAWLFTEAGAGAVLTGDPDKLWDETVRGMGFDPAMLLQPQTGRGGLN